MTGTALQISAGNTQTNQFPARYQAMVAAIAECHRVDECKELADRATAMAAYYKQIRDDTSMRQYHEVRLRSWRRLGELFAQIDTSSCETQIAKITLIRETLADPTTQSLRDHEIIRALKLARLPEDNFEGALDEAEGSFERMLRLGDPEWVARRDANFWRQQERQQEEDHHKHARQSALDEARRLEEEEWRQRQGDRLRGDKSAEKILSTEVEDDDVEVGLTLERHFRRPMKQFWFYLPAEAHEQLRTAAFNRRVTMHEVLREALDMWFVKSGLPARANV